MRTYEEKTMSWNLKMLTYMVEEAKEIKFYQYRSAMVFDKIMEMEDYQSSNNVKLIKLEDALYKKAGIKKRDNHVCFSVETENGNKLYFMFTDLNLIVGLGVRVKNW